MADDNGRELMRLSEARFSRKAQFDHLCQTLAEEFYPSRADFTTTLVEGEEFADHLFTSVPWQNLRDVSYAIGALTRPKNQPWFHIKAAEDWRNTERAKAWFAKARDRQRTLLYTHRASFASTLEISDRDVVAFGNAVIGHAESPERDGLVVYQAHHLRDCAWAENIYREVDELHRKFKLALCNWSLMFPGVPRPSEYDDLYKKEPRTEIDLRHICLPADRYEPYLKSKIIRRRPFASIYIDPKHARVIREGGYWEFPYTVRRWMLMQGTPYARSGAADLGLVEARLLQNQERVLLTAGELATDPPTIATRDAVLGEVGNYPGATTWVDYDYDERTGPALKTLEFKGQLPIGLEMKVDTREVLAAAMFINKLTLPVGNKDMTVPEVNERISEYIRSIGPAVEPFEVHNAMVLDHGFSHNLRVGQFGPLEEVPRELQGSEVVFDFDGPIQIAYKRQKLMKARETITEVIAPVAQINPETMDNFNVDRLARDAAQYIDGEPEWIVPENVVEAKRQQRAAKIAEAEQIEKLKQMGELAQGAAQTIPQIAQSDQSLIQMLEGVDYGASPGASPQDITDGAGIDDGLAALGFEAPLVEEADFDAGTEIEPELDEPVDLEPVAGPPVAEPVRWPRGGGRARQSAPEGAGVEGALRDLIKVLEQPLKARRNKAGRVVRFERAKAA